ncbi:MAG: DUF4347 domain-containing protein [Gammaproteobacteria bacterium]|nr:DUF4347 domain-containing protein [Gammaproteobacteria bacterium]MCP5136638.1 DUF4347 domain-containing protein [Gammaproteobacteria bacterium]
MVKLSRLEKRVVLDGGLVAEVGDAIAASATELLDRASTEGATTLEVMDQVLDSLGDAAMGPIGDAVQEGAAALTELADASSASTLVFVDGNVGDIDLIRAGMAPGAELHVLDINRDGLMQIADAMAGRSNIGAVHIISHGTPGTLSLGNTTVDFATLDTSQQSVLMQIGQAMTEHGDILIYGCDFAAGNTGAQAVERMATLTGADVAASLDRTGNADLGGDWDLEVAQGLIESARVLDAPSREKLVWVLGAVSDVTGANFGTESEDNPLMSWLDASETDTLNASTEGASISSWAQKSVTGRTLTYIDDANSSTNPATYRTANGGGVQFDGINDLLSVQVGVSSLNLNSGQFEVFLVAEIDLANTDLNGRFVNFTNSGLVTHDYTGNGFLALTALDGANGDTDRALGAYHAGNGTATIAAPGTGTHVFNSNGNLTEVGAGIDGSQTTGTISQSLGTVNANRYSLGGRYSSGDGYGAMTVHEVLIFDRQLNAAERSIINNYLAEKWSATGLSLGANDHFTGVGSITDAGATDLAGVGQESGDQVTTATSGGLTLTNNSFLANDGDYLMVAHDNGAASSASDGSIPSLSIDYVGRTWSADVTDAGSNGGTIDLEFDLNSFETDISKTGAAGSYRLIIDDSGDGFDDTDLTRVATTADGSSRVTFSGISVADLDGRRFTIGFVAADVTAPSVSNIAITSDSGGQNNTLNAGDTVNITVTMSEATNVTGSPQLALNIGGSTVHADYASGTGTTNLVFSYTIEAGQTDLNGISVDINSLSLNGGTLKDAALNDATLTHASVGDNANYLVDTDAPTASVAPATLNGSGNAMVQSSEVGTAYLVNENIAVSSLADITGAADNQFNQVAIAQADTPTALSATGLVDGTYRVYTIDAAGNLSEASSNQVIIDNTGPTVSNVLITSASGIQNNRLNVGDVVSVTVTMSENTTVTGTPQLALNIGGSTVQADYASGSGSTQLVFTYTIQAAQADADGISVDLDSLSLNGGTLRDATDNAATLTHAAVADNANYLVDTSAPTAPATAPDLATGSDTGTSESDNITSDNTPTFTGGPGSGVADDTVTIYANGIAVGSATVAGDGSYSVTTGLLSNGSYSITARFSDAAGNESGNSPALSPVVIDTAVPAAPTVTTTVSSSVTPTLAGTVTLGSGEALAVSLNGMIYTVGDGHLTEGGGTWSLAIPDNAALTEGTYTVIATVTDTAGNATSDPTEAELTVDFTAPAAPTILSIVAGDTQVSGTAEPGSTLQLTLPGGAVRTTSVAENGVWTINVTSAFTVGQTVIAKAIDSVGNESATALVTATQSVNPQSAVTDGTTGPEAIAKRATGTTSSPNPDTPSIGLSPLPTSVADADADSNSLFGGSLAGGLRSSVHLSGISSEAAESDSYGDDGLLSPRRSGGPNTEASGLFGDGFRNVEPAASRNPDTGDGVPIQDIQRFANAHDGEAELAGGRVEHLGRGDDEEKLQHNGATTDETAGPIGESALFIPAPNGVFGVRAGDFFRIFTEDGGQQAPGQDRREDTTEKPPQGVAPVLERATGQQAHVETDEIPGLNLDGSRRQA